MNWRDDPEYRLKLSEAQRRRWARVGEKEKLGKGTRDHWNSLSEDEKIARAAKISSGRLNMSKTDKITHAQSLSQATKNYWSNVSSEERTERGRRVSEAIRNMPAEARLAWISKFSSENHYDWKGDEALYEAIHLWVRKYWMVDHCEVCNQPFSPKELEAHNIPKTYKRIRTDWQFVCRPCHHIVDPNYQWWIKPAQRNH